MTDKEKSFIDLLNEEWDLLTNSIETLKKSMEKCHKLILKKSYNFEDEESFDSLTSKFSRTSDMYTQKVLRTIRMLLHEPFVPFIDNMNQFEKMVVIRSADEMIDIRDLRNQIAHEYLPEAIPQLVSEVLQFTKVLLTNIDKTKEFILKRGWIHPDLSKS